MIKPIIPLLLRVWCVQPLASWLLDEHLLQWCEHQDLLITEGVVRDRHELRLLRTVFDEWAEEACDPWAILE